MRLYQRLDGQRADTGQHRLLINLGYQRQEIRSDQLLGRFIEVFAVGSIHKCDFATVQIIPLTYLSNIY